MNEDMGNIIKINIDRLGKLTEKYDPISGMGCCGERFILSLSDSPIGDMWLPIEMRDSDIILELERCGSISKWLEYIGEEIDEYTMSEAWLNLCYFRMDYDFEYFAIIQETITDKKTGSRIPFRLNRGQRIFLMRLEKMRKKGISIRIILLKARQWGGSTLVQMYMYWIQMVIKTNWNSVICAHQMDAAKNIRAMFKECAKDMLPINGIKHALEPFEGAINIKQIKNRGCRITVGSAENPESVRSQDIKMVHFSEVAYYPKTENTNAKQLVTSIVSSIPIIPYTMIVYESTANGVGDFFHSEYLKAHNGSSPFEAVFISWFEIGDLYSVEFDGTYYDHNGRKKPGGYSDFIKDMSEYEINLFSNNDNLTLEHLNWYRQMKAQLGDDMQKEYPSDWIEAFKDSGETVFKADDVEALRDGCNKLPIAIGHITADGNASTAKISGISKEALTHNVRFIPDNDLIDVYTSSGDDTVKDKKLDGKLVIWKYPDKELNVLRRYIVVYDPQRGLTDKADWGVITVIDRYWRIYGGKSEIAAEIRTHIDKDIAAWMAVQVSIYYNNALLIIESNTFDSDYKKEDGTEFIFDTISGCYNNFYSRTPADKIKEGLPVKYGFHTGRSTKPAIMEDFKSTLRERSYIERSHRTLNQARLYERKKDGTYGAKEGYNDDDLMTRMIGLYVDYHEYDLPKIVDRNEYYRIQIPTNESSF